MQNVDWLQLNRDNWDERAAIHSASHFYDLPGFRAGACALRPFEIAELGDVTDKRLVHLQCHMGQDTLSWARRGAHVTGVDFSAEAITIARDLAKDTGLDDRARFVVSDVYNVAATLANERFDVVYTGLGALVWLPDLAQWAAVVAELLNDGGSLYLAEFHPLTHTLAEDGRELAHDYFDTSGITEDFAYTYTDGPPLSSTVSVQWQHPLGDVITALAQAGLRIEFLHEHPFTLFPQCSVLERSADTGEYRFPVGRPQIPLMYSLRATKSPR